MKPVHAPEISTFAAPSPPVSFDHLFTPEKIALGALRRRRRSRLLKVRVGAALKGRALRFLHKNPGPHALFFRQVGTPNNETLRFLRSAERLGLEPLILEYHGDKFVSAGNVYKRGLGKLPLFEHTGSDGRDMVRFKTIVDFNAYSGKKLSDVRTLSGEPLVAYHHKLLKEATSLDPQELCVDATQWFSRNGGAAEKYYETLMLLLIRDCIMFESYEATKSLQPFMREVIVPAFTRAQELTGERPLIVRLVPKGEELRAYWDAYPKKVQKLMR